MSLETKFFAPEALKEALEIISKKDCTIIAGGTDILVKKRKEGLNFPFILSLHKIGELKKIQYKNGKIIIGSMITHNEIANSVILKDKASALTLSASLIGSPQIRNMGTIGGNLVNASPAGDLIPPLYVFDAEIKLESKEGVRRLKVYEFFTGPKKSVIKKNEILSEISFKPKEKSFSTFLRIGQRKSLAISKASIALSCIRDGEKKLKDVKIAFGAVAPTVIYAPKTSEIISNKELNEKIIKDALEEVKNEVYPITDIRSTLDYRKKICAVLLYDALKKVFQDFNFGFAFHRSDAIPAETIEKIPRV